MASRHPARGHRKTWAMARHDGHAVSLLRGRRGPWPTKARFCALTAGDNAGSRPGGARRRPRHRPGRIRSGNPASPSTRPPAAGPDVSRAAPRSPGPAGAGHPPRTSTTRPPESSRPPRRPKPCSTGSRRWTVPPTPGRARPPRSRRSPTTAGRSGCTASGAPDGMGPIPASAPGARGHADDPGPPQRAGEGRRSTDAGNRRCGLLGCRVSGAGSRDEPQNERSAAGLPEELERVYDTPVVEQLFEHPGRFKPRRPARPRGRVLTCRRLT